MNPINLSNVSNPATTSTVFNDSDPLQQVDLAANGAQTLTQIGTAANSMSSGVGNPAPAKLESPAPPASPADNAEATATTNAALAAIPPEAMLAGSALLGLEALFAGATALGAMAQRPDAQPAAIQESATQISACADDVFAAFSDSVLNSSYPDFTSTLKELLATAQELKQLANEIKQASIESKYDTQMKGASKLEEAAQKGHESRLKSIEADKISAWSSLAFSVLVFPVAYAGGGAAAAAAAPMLSSAGQSVGTLVAEQYKIDSSNSQKEADLANAAKAEFDAAATRMDANTENASNLRDSMKSLIDHTLSLLQTLISNQAQTMEKAAQV
jgi:hypothetical protein